MDRHLFDILWEVYRDVDGKKPIQIISAYRSPETNAMLRRRSAHTGVARFSQHMLGHAMDFYIPDVPLEQIRYAGLRLQRGGVGFYPTSGSPFVHLDTGNIRHWPRMTHDQLARVFPDGRTVHVPSDGTPLKGYELARAEIERRGNGDDAATVAKPPNLLARLLGGKSNDDEDEGSLPAVQAKTVAVTQVAAAKPAEPAQAPRIKAAATLQLAAADMQIVQPKPKQATASEKAETKPQTPADIINARGFWDDMPAAPNQATPAQVAALNARKALASTDPQSTASVPAVYQALAYAPAESSSSADRAHIVAASAPIPRSARPASASRNSMVANDVTTVVAKSQGHQDGVVATSTRIVASSANDIWMRIVMLAPSASRSMSVTMLGDANLTLLSKLFQKPQATIVMGFSDDPLMGLTTDRFSGPATAPLTTQSFGLRTASLR
jgi:hypothetical protein